MSEQQLDSARLKSGLAAWLGWMFDGLDMHLYTLVAVPFVALLLGGVAEDSFEASSRPRSSSAGPWVAPSSGWLATASAEAGP